MLNRPILFASTPGDQILNCPDPGGCTKQVLALGNPVLWWGGTLALIAGLGYWLTRRDWRLGVAIVGVLTTWLPWFRYDNRQIFFYYGISIIPFTVIGLTLMLGKILGPATASYNRRLIGAVVVGAFVACVAACFVFFYPIWSDRLISVDDWRERIWLVWWNKARDVPTTSGS